MRLYPLLDCCSDLYTVAKSCSYPVNILFFVTGHQRYRTSALASLCMSVGLGVSDNQGKVPTVVLKRR